MTTCQEAGGESGHVRYTYRLRVSSTARAGLEAEWARCRWVWNECVAMSRKVHGLNRDAEQKTTCGPAQLDKLLTEARAARTGRMSIPVPAPCARSFGRVEGLVQCDEGVDEAWIDGGGQEPVVLGHRAEDEVRAA
ncbi:hypothetical protein RKD28_004036 [Streptomyces sp. SAI-229]